MKQIFDWVPKSTNHQLIIVVLIASFLFVYVLSRNLFQPWNSFLEGEDGALYSSIARNYLRYGPRTLFFGQARNYELVSDVRDLYFYQHHPPLLPLLVSASFKMFGESEGSARLITILASIGNAVCMFALSISLYGRRNAVASSFVFGTLPAILFFGRKPGHEPLSLFFILLSLWFYIRLLKGEGHRSVLGLNLAAFLGLMTAWPVYIWSGLVALHCRAFTENRRLHIAVSLGLPILAISVFCLLQIQSELVSPGSLSDLIDQGRVYMGLYSFNDSVVARYPEARAVPVSEMIGRVLYNVDFLFAYPVLLLAAFGVWKAFRSEGFSSPIFLLLGVAVLYAAVFYRSVILHYWHLYYFAAPVALFAAAAVNSTKNGSAEVAVLSPRRIQLFLALLIIIGAAPRLWSLHQLQIKIFPFENPQPADFTRNLGELVKSLSKNDDVVIVNLPNFDVKIRQTVGYYAARRLVWDDNDMAGVRRDNRSGQGKVYYVRVLPEPGQTMSEKESTEFPSRSVVTRFLVDGYSVYWAALTASIDEVDVSILN